MNRLCNWKFPCALAALAIGLSAATAQAANVYEQLTDGSNNGFFSDGNQGVQFYDNRIADNFTLFAPANIVQVQWWGGSENFLSPDILLNTNAFVISFYTDAGGLPVEPPIYTETIPIGSITATPTGEINVAGGIEYLFVANLAAPVAIPASTARHLHIGAILISPQDDAFAWHTANADNLFSGDGLGPLNDGIWEPQTLDDMAFRLLDDTEGGRCCLPAGDCIIEDETDCLAQSGTFGGDNSTCGNGSLCRGRCCDNFGGCEVTGPVDCGAPSIFGGLGTNCSDPGICQGRCCAPIGTCTLTGPANCIAPSTFSGPGTTCSDITPFGNPNPPTVNIPTTGTAGASEPSVISVSDNFPIQDVNVRIKIQHTYRLDLILCLTAPGGGPTIQLSAGTGCTTGGNCGGEDNYNAVFDDEGAAINCASPNIGNINAVPDHILPGTSLTAFDGLSSAGDWTLNIFDQFGGDLGVLLEWELQLDSGNACQGACCAPNTSCSITGELPCQQAGGTFQGAGSPCSPSPCAPNGACCIGGTCSQQSAIDCAANNGVFGGVSSSCTNAPCFVPCCKQDGVCQLLTLAACNALPFSVAGAPGSPCPGDPCIQVGACCFDDFTCQAPLTEAACTGLNGVRWRPDVGCLPEGCRGRCCHLNGTCTLEFPANCVAPDVYGGDGSTCSSPNVCAGACCAFNGGECTMQGPGSCLAPDVFAGIGSNCQQVQCSGRCCQASGACAITSVGGCTGTFTIGLTCDPVEIFQFNNVNMFMQDNPVQTPSSNIQTVETTGPLLITDLDVDLNAVHAWPGDVRFILSHLGTSVIIYDRPGEPVLFFGCATDDFNIVLDDEGTGGPIETVCNPLPPSALSPPNYTPNNPLSAFDGMNAAGEWTITSIDFFNGDNGTLLSWSLHVGYDGQACPGTGGCTCFGDLNGDSVVNGKDIKPFANCVAAGGAGCPCGDMNHAGGATSADVTAFVNAVMTSTCGTP